MTWCVALGAATTIVVAWACWLFSFGTKGWIGAIYCTRTVTPGYRLTYGARRVGYELYQLIPQDQWYSQAGPEAYQILDHEPEWVTDWLINESRGSLISLSHVSAAGWPLLCLGGVWDWNGSIVRCRPSLPLWIEPSTPATGNARRVCLPLRPIYSGFLINTLVYTVLWFGLITLIPAIRRRSRRRRDCCPACAYDLRGLASVRCPECGTATILPAACPPSTSKPA